MTSFWFIDTNGRASILDGSVPVSWQVFNDSQDVLFHELESNLISHLMHTDYGYTLVF